MKKLNYWLVAGSAVFFIVLAADLFTDLRSDSINHTRGAFLRALGLLPCLIFFSLAPKKTKWYIPLIVLAMIGINYWNLFDGLYNLFRGFGWFFTGSEDGADDAKTDNFLQSIPLWAHVFIKIGGSIATILIYIKAKK